MRGRERDDGPSGGGAALFKAAMENRKAPGPCEGAVLALIALCQGTPKVAEGGGRERKMIPLIMLILGPLWLLIKK